MNKVIERIYQVNILPTIAKFSWRAVLYFQVSYLLQVNVLSCTFVLRKFVDRIIYTYTYIKIYSPPHPPTHPPISKPGMTFISHCLDLPLSFTQVSSWPIPIILGFEFQCGRHTHTHICKHWKPTLHAVVIKQIKVEGTMNPNLADCNTNTNSSRE